MRILRYGYLRMRISNFQIIMDADADIYGYIYIDCHHVQTYKNEFQPHKSVLPGCRTGTQLVMHPTYHFPQPPPLENSKLYLIITELMLAINYIQ